MVCQIIIVCWKFQVLAKKYLLSCIARNCNSVILTEGVILNTKIMNAFGDNEFPYGTDDSSTIAEEPSENMSKDFKNMTYDKYFKNVFSIKRIIGCCYKGNY